MTGQENIYESFADVLSYPTQDYHAKVKKCQIAITNYKRSATLNPEPLTLINSFSEFIKDKSVADLEEHFTQTFDINPISCLEVGWHLFGETYDRGAFLVRMRELLRQFNIKESTELPDHITHVLAVLGKMEKESADDFANAQVLPAIKKMIDGFGGKENPYINVLKALQIFIQENHAQKTEIQSEATLN